MEFKRFFVVRSHGAFPDAALLVLRVVAGVAFMFHGWGKIQNPFGWMGEGAFAPGIFQALAAVSEFGGGLCWVLGLLMPLASLGIAGTMTVAAWMHAVVWGDPFVAGGEGGSYELALVYLCVALVFVAMGPGRFSVDNAVFKSQPVETR